MRADDRGPQDVIVDDLSATGFSFRSDDPVAIGTALSIGLAGAGRAEGRVTWQEGGRYGCTFDDLLSSAQLDAAFTAQPVIRALIASSPSGEPGAISRPETTDARFPVALSVALMISLGAGGWTMFAVIAKALQG